MKVTTESGTHYKATEGSKEQSRALTAEEAERIAAELNRRAEALELEVRYKAVADDDA